MNEFRIICSRFLGQLGKLDQAYVKRNKTMQDKIKAISEEVNVTFFVKKNLEAS